MECIVDAHSVKKTLMALAAARAQSFADADHLTHALVLLSTGNGALRLSITDLDLTITRRLAAHTMYPPARVVVAIDAFSIALQRLCKPIKKGRQLRLWLDADGMFCCADSAASANVVRLPCSPLGAYPLMVAPRHEDMYPVVELSGVELQGIATNVCYAADPAAINQEAAIREELLANITTVLGFDRLTDGRLEVGASNLWRGALHYIKFPPSKTGDDQFVRRWLTHALHFRRMCAALPSVTTDREYQLFSSQDGTVLIIESRLHGFSAIIVCDPLGLTSNKSERPNFPKYRAIIPKAPNVGLEIDRQLLLDAILAVVTHEKGTAPQNWETTSAFSSDVSPRLVLKHENKIGKPLIIQSVTDNYFQQRVPVIDRAVLSATPLRVLCSSRYLVDALYHIAADEISFVTNTFSGTPLIIAPISPLLDFDEETITAHIISPLVTT